jgi:hypothetical protein
MKKTTTNQQHASWRILAIVIVLLLTGSVAMAQDGEGFTSGPYDFNFGLLAGYRATTTTGLSADAANNFTEIDDYWSQQRYYEAMNYRSGLIVKSLNLSGERKGAEGFFDQMYLTADGIGDPFTTAQLRFRSFDKYDFRVDYRNSRYFMNRNDSIYTGLHKFDETRQMLGVSLDVNASDDIRLRANYRATSHSGNFTTTVSPFIQGGEEKGGATFGTYARGNFYWMNSPKNDKTDEFSLQGTFKVAEHTDFTLGGGYRMFKQDYIPDPLNDTSLTYLPAKGQPNWSGIVNTSSSSANNPLIDYSWHENQKSNTPFGYIDIVSRPIDRLSIAANLRYEDTKMEGTIDGNFIGVMPAAKGVRNVADTTAGVYTNTLTSLFATLTLTGTLTDNLVVTGMYRYTGTDLKGDGLVQQNVGVTDTVTSSVYKPLFSGPFEENVTSKITQQYVDGYINFTPLSMLNVRGGVQYMTRTPDYNRVTDGVQDTGSNLSLNRYTSSLTPYFNFWWRPIHELKVEGRYSHTTMKSNFKDSTNEADLVIRRVPKNTDRYSIGFDVDPVKDIRLGLKYDGMMGSSDLLNMVTGNGVNPISYYNPQLKTDMQSISGSVNWRILKQTTLIVTGQYKENNFAVPTSFTRGSVDPTPVYGDSLTVDDEEHTIDRTIDASISSTPIDPLHLFVGYTIIRSTGGSYLTPDVKPGVAPDIMRVGGPYTWYQLHATAGYDITKNIGLQVDFQMAQEREDMIDNLTGIINNYKVSLLRGSIYFKL